MDRYYAVKIDLTLFLLQDAAPNQSVTMEHRAVHLLYEAKADVAFMAAQKVAEANITIKTQ